MKSLTSIFENTLSMLKITFSIYLIIILSFSTFQGIGFFLINRNYIAMDSYIFAGLCLVGEILCLVWLFYYNKKLKINITINNLYLNNKKIYMYIFLFTVFFVPTSNLLLDMISTSSKTSTSPGDHMNLLMFFVIAIIGPIVEEYAFRYILLNKFLETNNFIVANIFQAIFFALYHFSLSYFVFHFISGLLFGYFYKKTGKLKTAILFHGFTNAISSLQTIYGFDITLNSSMNNFIGGLIGSIILIVFISKIHFEPVNVQDENYETYLKTP